MLRAFINQVNDLVGPGTLTPAQGRPLINKANEAITLLAGHPLLAAAAAPANAAREPLAQATLKPLFAEAIVRWQAAGVATSSLTAIDIRLADLPGATLGLASGDTIWLDDDAAGWGWFVDATPGDDAEFTTSGSQGEQGRMDLLTVLAHEIGHLLGHNHDADGLMAQTLTAGTRREPGHDARLGDLTVMLFSIDVPVDARTGFDPTSPWGHRRK